MTEIQDPGLQRPTNEERTRRRRKRRRRGRSGLRCRSAPDTCRRVGWAIRCARSRLRHRAALVNTNTSMTTGPIDMPTGVQRTLNAIRAALPWVQRFCPSSTGISARPSPISSRRTITRRLPRRRRRTWRALKKAGGDSERDTDLQTQQKELRGAIQEQNASLKRVEDQLEMVREATDRNTLEQQELMEDLKVVGNKVNMFAAVALGLLGLSVLLNIFLICTSCAFCLRARGFLVSGLGRMAARMVIFASGSFFLSEEHHKRPRRSSSNCVPGESGGPKDDASRRPFLSSINPVVQKGSFFYIGTSIFII